MLQRLVSQAADWKKKSSRRHKTKTQLYVKNYRLEREKKKDTNTQQKGDQGLALLFFFFLMSEEPLVEQRHSARPPQQRATGDTGRVEMAMNINEWILPVGVLQF